MGTKEVYIARLGEARKGLQEARFLFIISTAKILENKSQDASFWFSMWSTAFQDQKRLSLENISRAKKALNLPLTNETLETEVIRESHKTSRALGLNKKFGEGTVLFHIEQTKIYQRNKGIIDKNSSDKIRDGNREKK